jgi:hypothetical protein
MKAPKTSQNISASKKAKNTFSTICYQNRYAIWKNASALKQDGSKMPRRKKIDKNCGL